MNTTHIFDMISRTVGEQLPDCDFFNDEEIGRWVVTFYGTLDELSSIPIHTDFILDQERIVGDAHQVVIQPNHTDYEAVYHAYVVHYPTQSFAS